MLIIEANCFDNVQSKDTRLVVLPTTQSEEKSNQCWIMISKVKSNFYNYLFKDLELQTFLSIKCFAVKILS